MFTFEKFVEYGFCGLITGLLAFSVKFLSNISKTNTTLTTQVNVLANNFDWHHNAIKTLDGRVRRLETNNRKGR